MDSPVELYIREGIFVKDSPYPIIWNGGFIAKLNGFFNNLFCIRSSPIYVHIYNKYAILFLPNRTKIVWLGFNTLANYEDTKNNYFWRMGSTLWLKSAQSCFIQIMLLLHMN